MNSCLEIENRKNEMNCDNKLYRVRKNISCIVENTIQKAADFCCESRDDRVIIQYGIQQGLRLVIHMIVLFICGMIWDELLFTFVVFLGTALLRPYTGGYHADTEIRCFLVSVSLVNMVIVLKKVINVGMVWYVFWSAVMYLIIWRLAPVENPVRRLEACEKKIYQKKAKKYLTLYSVFLFCGFLLKNLMLVEAVTAVVTIVALLAVLGKMKYQMF